MTIPADVHIYVRSVRGDSLTGQKGFEPECKLRKLAQHRSNPSGSKGAALLRDEQTANHC